MVQLGFFFYAVYVVCIHLARLKLMLTFDRDNFLVDIPLKIVFATIYMMFYSIIISILKVCSACKICSEETIKFSTSIFLYRIFRILWEIKTKK